MFFIQIRIRKHYCEWNFFHDHRVFLNFQAGPGNRFLMSYIRRFWTLISFFTVWRTEIAGNSIFLIFWFIKREWSKLKIQNFFQFFWIKSFFTKIVLDVIGNFLNLLLLQYSLKVTWHICLFQNIVTTKLQLFVRKKMCFKGYNKCTWKKKLMKIYDF
jgi:hypothetical protein